MFDAPYYKGSGKLQDKVGADHRRRLRHRPRRGRAVRARRRRCRHRLPRRGRGRRRHQGAVEKEGRRCILLAGDVADPSFCAKAVAHTVEEFGRLDVLVNNAAFQEHVERLRGSHRRAFRPDAEDQPLRLLPHGPGGGAAHGAGLGASS